MTLKNWSPAKHKQKPRKVVFDRYLAFHGSSENFEQFDPDTGRYESRLLCLSASPLVAACYGTHIYSCVLNQVRLIAIASYEWLHMSDLALSRFKKHDADGFLIYPIKKPSDVELHATFSVDMIALWHFGKCRIVTHIKAHETDPSLKIAPIYQ